MLHSCFIFIFPIQRYSSSSWHLTISTTTFSGLTSLILLLIAIYFQVRSQISSFRTITSTLFFFVSVTNIEVFIVNSFIILILITLFYILIYFINICSIHILWVILLNPSLMQFSLHFIIIITRVVIVKVKILVHLIHCYIIVKESIDRLILTGIMIGYHVLVLLHLELVLSTEVFCKTQSWDCILLKYSTSWM